MFGVVKLAIKNGELVHRCVGAVNSEEKRRSRQHVFTLLDCKSIRAQTTLKGLLNEALRYWVTKHKVAIKGKFFSIELQPY